MFSIIHWIRFFKIVIHLAGVPIFNISISMIGFTNPKSIIFFKPIGSSSRSSKVSNTSENANRRFKSSFLAMSSLM